MADQALRGRVSEQISRGSRGSLDNDGRPQISDSPFFQGLDDVPNNRSFRRVGAPAGAHDIHHHRSRIQIRIRNVFRDRICTLIPVDHELMLIQGVFEWKVARNYLSKGLELK